MEQDRLYSKSHAWAKVEGDMATVGITEFAQVWMCLLALRGLAAGSPERMGGASRLILGHSVLYLYCTGACYLAEEELVPRGCRMCHSVHAHTATTLRMSWVMWSGWGCPAWGRSSSTVTALPPSSPTRWAGAESNEGGRLRRGCCRTSGPGGLVACLAKHWLASTGAGGESWGSQPPAGRFMLPCGEKAQREC